MTQYLLRRLGQSVIVLLGVSVIVFCSLYLTGDPAALMLPRPRAGLRSTRFGMRWDSMIPWRCSMSAIWPCVGRRFRHFPAVWRPVTGLIAERIPATVLLALTALAWSTLLGFVFGIVAAVYKGWGHRFSGADGSHCPARRCRCSGLGFC